MLGKISVCAAALVGATAHVHGGPCPYLQKVVPLGEARIAVVNHVLQSLSEDCKDFAYHFTEHVNVTYVCGRSGNAHHLHTRKEIGDVCSRRPVSKSALKSVFPDFETGDTLFEVEHTFGESHRVAALWQTHTCKKTNKISWAEVVAGTPSTMPEMLTQASERFAFQVLEAGNCAVYDELAENDVSVRLHGVPHHPHHHYQHRGASDSKRSFQGSESVKAACDVKVTQEKRFHTSVSLAIRSRYYDASRNEITLVGSRDVTTIFMPGKIVEKPVAVTLKFSEKGAIQAAQFYETDVFRLEQKFGTKYGGKAAESASAEGGSSWMSKAWSMFKPTTHETQTFGLKDLPPAVRAKKCAWLDEHERAKGGCKWMKMKPWYQELVVLCMKHEQEQHETLSPDEKAKKCASIEAVNTGEPSEVHQFTRVRALASLCNLGAQMGSMPVSAASTLGTPVFLAIGLSAAVQKALG